MLKKVLLLPVVLVLVAIVGVGAVIGLDKLGFSILGNDRESRSSEVISAVTREQQVVLLSLGIQGIDVEKDSSSILGQSIWGTGRSSFLQYNFDAKLGIEGQDVTIEETGAKTYRVTIPDFVFIGHDNPEFQSVVEDNGALSFATPEIDTAEVITEILNDDTKDEYVAKNVDLLRDQAKVFYEGIIRGIDPTLEVEFDYAGDAA